ncbi:regulator of microtubule dynamics protein 1-like [Uranotaenia lowii]|uniref:regulator of microtubule dynamics protein 1-like n=1 Tax=Uranotaenia lowii TaxID=190385 RepID=UPI0024788223|nr:regulator of microtubule dynamics protein 1-like [Uranotaenia lowii]
MRIFFISLGVFFIFCPSVFGFNPPEKMSAEELKLADELFDDAKYQDTVYFLEKLSDKNSVEVQWRFARAVFFVSKQIQDGDQKEKLVREAFDYACKALELDDANFGANKWYGAILSEKSNFDGMTERIKQLDNVKKHFSKAKDANPEDPGIWHMLGQFNFKLSEVNWVTRKLINSIAPNPPTASYEEALECFEKAENMKPGFYSQNQLFLGKTYLALKQKDKAREWFQKASEVEVRSEDDRVCRQEASEALKKL